MQMTDDDYYRKYILDGFASVTHQFTMASMKSGVEESICSALNAVITGAVHLGADKSLRGVTMMVSLDRTTYSASFRPYSEDPAAIVAWEHLFPPGTTF